MNTQIEFTRIGNDTNGNPRYVCHFFNLLTKEELGYYNEEENRYYEPTLSLQNRYNVAIKRANKIGGRKFHNKQYGGGIVFQSYNIQADEKRIFELVQTNQ